MSVQPVPVTSGVFPDFVPALSSCSVPRFVLFFQRSPRTTAFSFPSPSFTFLSLPLSSSPLLSFHLPSSLFISIHLPSFPFISIYLPSFVFHLSERGISPSTRFASGTDMEMPTSTLLPVTSTW